MPNEILFNLDSSLKINQGASLEELVNILQNFTSENLYLEDGLLKSIELSEIEEESGYNLIEVRNGFLLEKMGQKIQVFKREFMEYLTEVRFPTVYDFDLDTTQEFSSLQDSDDLYSKTSFTEFQGYQDAIRQDSQQDTILQETIPQDKSYETDTLSRNELKEAVLKLYQIQNPEKSNYLSEETSEDSNDSIESVEIITLPKIDTFDNFEDSAIPIESEDDEYLNPEYLNPEYLNLENSLISHQRLEKIWFRLLFKDLEDSFVDKDMFFLIEDENEIDLRETIEISFNRFLERQGFVDSKISIEFNDDISEVCIETYLPLTFSAIDTIETDAQLSVFDDETIVFIFERIETHVELYSQESIIGKLEDLDVTDEYIYSDDVSIYRLPLDIVEIIMNKIPYLISEGDSAYFMYNSTQFSVKNEGDELYSVFDHELFLPLTHLNPSLYRNTFAYSDLPVCQFYC